MNNLIGVMQGRLTDSDKLDFFPFGNWKKEFSIAKKIGFSIIEWGFSFEKWKENPILSKKGILKIKELCLANKISVSSICGYFFVDSAFSGKESDRTIKILNRLIVQGAKIGVKRIIIPFLGKGEIKNEKDKKEIIKNLKPCLKIAEKNNISILFETSLAADELKKFINRFKSPCVKVCYDTGNCTTFFGKKVPLEIKKLKGLISEIHIKDRKFKEETTYPLGMGGTDFEKVFKALKTIKFNGPFIFEAARNPKINNIALNKQYLKFIKKYL